MREGEGGVWVSKQMDGNKLESHNNTSIAIEQLEISTRSDRESQSPTSNRNRLEITCM